MRSRMLNLLVDEVLKKIGAASPPSTSLMPVLSVDDTSNTVTLGLSNGETLPGVQAQSGYIPEPGHIATIIQNGMDLIVLPPSGPMTSTPPAATTGLVVTPGINMLVCTWDQAPEADVANNRGFYQVQWASDSGMTQNVQTHVVAANAAVLSPLTVETWVQVRAIDQAGYPGPYCTPVAGTPATVPAPDGAAVTQALIDQATSTSATLATDALTFLIVNSDGTVSKAAASFGKVTADEIEATAIGAVAVGAYALTAVNIAAGAIDTAQLAAGSVTASILDANAINGKTIVGANIQTAASGSYVLLDSTSSANEIQFVSPGHYNGRIAVVGTDLELLPPDSEVGISIYSGSYISLDMETRAGQLDASVLTRNSNSVWARDDLYIVQVSFTPDGSSLQFTVSYSCPFTPTMAVATSNNLGCKIDNVTSITASSCVIQASQITGAVLASGSSIPVTLHLS